MQRVVPKLFIGLVVVSVLGLLLSPGMGKAFATVTVTRCGYATYGGRSAVYPWHMSCRSARQVVIDSANPHDRMIELTAPASDGAVIRIANRWWVCTGQMGYYNCGYPYRPAYRDDGTSYKGPFTEDVAFQQCDAIEPRDSGCLSKTQFAQPLS
jgi:hypothetical protein